MVVTHIENALSNGDFSIKTVARLQQQRRLAEFIESALPDDLRLDVQASVIKTEDIEAVDEDSGKIETTFDGRHRALVVVDPA